MNKKVVDDKLDDLRDDMKIITQQIISLINKRMEIAKQIGHIKNELNLDVVDGKVEQDIKNYILKYSNNNGLDPEFSCRILNLLINESVIIQNKEKKNKLSLDIIKNDVQPITTKNNSSNYNGSNEIIKIRTHMDVFNKAKQLESMGKNIIHLEVGEPDFAPPIQVKEALSSIYDKYQFHYTETAGIFELRKKICINLENLVENTSSNMLPENLITTVGGR
ncbi:MAG TPA: chorismate mutase, partial [Candidatus Nitrosocosmicus sp.]